MKARIDFHIHSCLSPCGSLDLSPREIVRRYQEQGVDCIALTDHSCARNLPAFEDACAAIGMNRLYGMEVSTAEEVHVLALFDDLPCALDFGSTVYAHLPDFPADPDTFGAQPVVTADETVTAFAGKLLVAATDLSFFDLVPMVQNAGALCIPAHIDRPMCGAIAHLGFLPDLPYDAVEAVGPVDAAIARRWPVVRFSDAHHPSQIARRTTVVRTDAFTVPALRRAFRQLLPVS